MKPEQTCAASSVHWNTDFSMDDFLKIQEKINSFIEAKRSSQNALVEQLIRQGYVAFYDDFGILVLDDRLVDALVKCCKEPESGQASYLPPLYGMSVIRWSEYQKRD